MKKILLVVPLLVVMLFSSCGNQSSDNFSIDKEGFVTTLEKEGLLPQEITASLDGPTISNLEDDEELYKWDKFGNGNEDIHNIQAVFSENEIKHYVYKNYDFETPKLEKPLSNEEAAKLAQKFSKTFIAEGEKLEFVNDPEIQNQSQYNPGHVETWSAKNGEYTIVIDLDMGSVIRYYRNY